MMYLGTAVDDHKRQLGMKRSRRSRAVCRDGLRWLRESKEGGSPTKAQKVAVGDCKNRETRTWRAIHRQGRADAEGSSEEEGVKTRAVHCLGCNRSVISCKHFSSCYSAYVGAGLEHADPGGA
eukprot:2668616-Amphidinium_carterae.1